MDDFRANAVQNSVVSFVKKVGHFEMIFLLRPHKVCQRSVCYHLCYYVCYHGRR